jgi:hypothetical protein
MTRTHSIEEFIIPEEIPGIATITMAASVTGMSSSSGCDEILKKGNRASVVVGPTWFSSPQKQRKLWLDYSKKAKPEFASDLAGELNVEGKKVFIFLEK